MTMFKQIHKNEYLQTLSSTELDCLRSITEKKIVYYKNLLEEATKAEEENQDDYGILATAQAEMDHAERKIMKCEEKLKVITLLLTN